MSAASTSAAPDTHSAVACGDGPFSERSSEMLGLGMAGAMTAAVFRRIADGCEADDHDHRILADAAKILNAAANTKTFFQSQGRSGRYPSGGCGGSAAGATMLADVVNAYIPGEDDIERLQALAAAVTAVAESPDPAAALALVPVFSHLARAGTGAAGSPGCGTLSDL